MLRVGLLSVIRSAGLIAMLTMASGAQATFLPTLAAARYSVLYTGMRGQSISITNGRLDIDFGGTGNVQFKGPRAIDRRLDFAAADAYFNNNGSNVGPTSINQNQAIVATDTFTILSNPSASSVPSPGPITDAYFNDNGSNVGPTSINQNQAIVTTDTFTILSNPSASSVPSPGPITIALNKLSGAEGVILAANDTMSITNGNLTGRFFGGSDLQIGLDPYITASTIQEPASIAVFAAGLFGFGLFFGRRWRPVRTDPSPS